MSKLFVTKGAAFFGLLTLALLIVCVALLAVIYDKQQKLPTCIDNGVLSPSGPPDETTGPTGGTTGPTGGTTEPPGGTTGPSGGTTVPPDETTGPPGGTTGPP